MKPIGGVPHAGPSDRMYIMARSKSKMEAGSTTSSPVSGSTPYIPTLSRAESCANAPCGCGRAHRLHWMKEPCIYVEDTQQYWSAWCYIGHLTMQLSNMIGERTEIMEQTTADENQIKWASNRIDHLEKKVKHWQELYIEDATHKADCNVSEMAASGRDIEVKCTCGYNDRIKSIEESVNRQTSGL